MINLFQSLFRPKWEDAFRECKTPEDVSNVVRRNISQEEDDGIPRTCRQVWDRGKGDCEDFARMVVSGCRQIKSAAEMYFIYNAGRFVNGKGHAIVFGVLRDGTSWQSDLGEYRVVRGFDEVRSLARRTLGDGLILYRQVDLS